MPCNSDYMHPSKKEEEMSKIVQLLDELDGKGMPNPRSYGQGYDERVYNKKLTDEFCDKLVSELCHRISVIPPIDLPKYSLELQLWWRDHQREDKKRLELEMLLAKTEAEKQVALSKLTPYEKQLLKIKD